jgi:hypothetical protein
VTTPTSINNKTPKVKSLREGGFCVFLLFSFLAFFLWWVLLKKFLSSLKSFLSPRI